MRILRTTFEWLRENFWLKLFSLIFALVVWFWASGWVYHRVAKTVPVTLNLAPQMTLKSISPPAVEVVLETPGPVVNLGGASGGTPEVVHDMTETKEPGKFLIALSSRNVRVPFRASVVSVNPSRIDAEIDRLTDKVLPVKVVYNGQPSSGYRIAGQTVMPPEVLIPGPDSVLKDMSAIETEPINVAGRRESFPEDARLKPVSPDPAIQPKPVRVRVEIAPVLENRLISGIPVALLRAAKPADEVTIVPTEIKVTLRGQKIPLESVMPRDIKAYVDVSDLGPGLYQLPLQTKLPANIVLETAEPAVIKVTVGQPAPPLAPGLQ